MSASEVDALLERLVAQFESPYDFLRELVQNAMDAGSDRVEVTLESHRADGSGARGGSGAGSGAGNEEVVFELTILDTGAGMDEAIIDQELTRLFSSGKSGDRTMAGGFGIGFVSVFAWDPEAVLVHTGRGGESWELVFYRDRSFEKVALEDPVEGTTISMLRRGRASEREPIAEAIRESLWRWCRYCPLELSFADLDGDDPPELIQDAPEPAEHSLGSSRGEVRGESTLRVSFAVPANVVFLRRGLILAEGGPRQLFPPAIAEALGPSCDHLQIWADSPQLRTTLARDKVVDDTGREAVQKRLLELVAALREDLLARLQVLADTIAEGPAGEAATEPAGSDRAWTRERHAIYAGLQAHLGLELHALGDRPRKLAILRDLAHGRGVSLDAAVERMAGRPLLIATPPAVLRGGHVDRGQDQKSGASPIADGVEALLAALAPTSLPVIAGERGDDSPWLEDLAALRGVELLPVERALARVEVQAEEAVGLCGLVQGLLRGLGFEELRVQVGRFIDVQGRPERSPVFGPEVVGAATPLAFHGGRTIPRSSLRRRALWLNLHNTLVEAAIAGFTARPLLAGLALTAGMLGHLDEDPEPSDLAKVAEGLDRASAEGRQ